MASYYNEFDPFAAAWLRELIIQGHIAPGDVDERSIVEVKADDIKGYAQCHFFAGIGGWSLALRKAMWPDDRPVWTGSAPCQPFSSAGKQKGKADERHLFPVWLNLIRECRPATIFGEQVSSAVAHGWLDDVYQGLEAEGYAVGSAVLPACSVGAPHRRDRLWFVANANCYQPQRRSSKTSGEGQEVWIRPSDDTPDACCDVADTQCIGRQGRGALGESSNPAPSCDGQTNQSLDAGAGFWDGEWLACPDGKTRLVEPGIPLLAHGVPNRVGKLRGYGNAIVPQVAAAFIKSSAGE